MTAVVLVLQFLGCFYLTVFVFYLMSNFSGRDSIPNPHNISRRRQNIILVMLAAIWPYCVYRMFKESVPK